MASSPDSLQAVLAFLSQAVETHGRIIVELLKLTDGELPNETRRAIHEHLRPLSEAAIGVPEEISALRHFDLLVGLIPPPNA